MYILTSPEQETIVYASFLGEGTMATLAYSDCGAACCHIFMNFIVQMRAAKRSAQWRGNGSKRNPRSSPVSKADLHSEGMEGQGSGIV